MTRPVAAVPRPIRGSRTRSIRTPFDTEFSVVLAALVKQVQGSVGAVLTDIAGDAIDYVHVPNELAELDVQIAGAQIIQAVAETQQTGDRWGLGRATLMFEGPRASILAGMVTSEYLLTVVLAPQSNLARGLQAFESAVARLEEYLA